MSAQDFLVELGTEELPPKALKSLGEAFLAGIEKGLKAAGLNYAASRVYAAPRRLAVLEERERIGMDLHDGIIQSIYAVGLTLEYIDSQLADGEVAQADVDLFDGYGLLDVADRHLDSVHGLTPTAGSRASASPRGASPATPLRGAGAPSRAPVSPSRCSRGT